MENSPKRRMDNGGSVFNRGASFFLAVPDGHSPYRTAFLAVPARSALLRARPALTARLILAVPALVPLRALSLTGIRASRNYYTIFFYLVHGGLYFSGLFP